MMPPGRRRDARQAARDAAGDDPRPAGLRRHRAGCSTRPRRKWRGAMPDGVERVICAQVREAIDYHLAHPRRAACAGAPSSAPSATRSGPRRAPRATSRPSRPTSSRPSRSTARWPSASATRRTPTTRSCTASSPAKPWRRCARCSTALREGLLPWSCAIGAGATRPAHRFPRARTIPSTGSSPSALKMAREARLRPQSRAPRPTRSIPSRSPSPATTSASPRASSRTGCRRACSARCTRPATRSTSSASTRLPRTPLATDLVGLYAVWGVSFGAHEMPVAPVGKPGRPLAASSGRSTSPRSADVLSRAAGRRRRPRTSGAASTACEPGFIRVEADELTYDFHVMLRTDIEAALIDGSLSREGPARGLERQDQGISRPRRARRPRAACCRTSTGPRARSAPSATTPSAMSWPGQLFATAKEDAAIAAGPRERPTTSRCATRWSRTSTGMAAATRATRSCWSAPPAGRSIPSPTSRTSQAKYSELYGL